MATTIGPSVAFDGELTSDEDLVFEGRFRGHVIVRQGTLTIGGQAQLESDIRCIRAVVLGTVRGSISASERIELGPSAMVIGNLTAERIVIADGAFFTGGIDMGRRTIAARLAQYRERSAAR
jgi:cytoskeletal protein CcmA (bactofilin family)